MGKGSARNGLSLAARPAGYGARPIGIATLLHFWSARIPSCVPAEPLLERDAHPRDLLPARWPQHPIAYAEHMVRRHLRYQLAAYRFANPCPAGQMRERLSLDETQKSPSLDLMNSPLLGPAA